jgi:hypothetical protein
LLDSFLLLGVFADYTRFHTCACVRRDDSETGQFEQVKKAVAL